MTGVSLDSSVNMKTFIYLWMDKIKTIFVGCTLHRTVKY